MKQFLIVMALALISWSCSVTHQNEKIISKPKNIILLIGDGMGLSQVSLNFYTDDVTTNFNRFKQISLMKTSSATHKITDSGAGGTALSCGVKTYNGAIGMGNDTNSVENITEILAEKGVRNGIVATSSITHATPAAFYAHVPIRKMENEIALQMLATKVDFFAGGGIKYFAKRKDGQNLILKLEAKGYIVDTNSLVDKDLLNQDKKYAFLLSDNGMPEHHKGRGDFLPKATELAINYLNNKGKGFFLMSESSQIDWAGHKNDNEYMLAEMEDFDKTIGVAMDFAEKDGNTLVIVLADHETGGFSLSSGMIDEYHGDYESIVPNYATGGHTAALVPVFAYGPGSELFDGIYENTEVFYKMLEAIKE